jgi:uncharacterized protein YlzI (FlbEa/FlbD family)
VQDQVQELKDKIEEWKNEIGSYHSELLEDGDAEQSIKNKIGDALTISTEDASKVSENLEAVKTMIAEASEELGDLKGFYDSVYGVESEEGKRSGGLKSEINKRREDLDGFATEQQQKYDGLVGKIEELLPGALSAGLATAFHERAKKFTYPIWGYTFGFYASVLCILFTAYVFASPYFEYASTMFDVKLQTSEAGVVAKAPTLSDTLTYMLVRVPVFIPLFWSALFTSKGRSQYLRLREEYMHKEVVGRSFSSVKSQLGELAEGESELLKHLLEETITAIAHNASDTLDKRHGEKSPTSELVDKVVEKVKKSIKRDEVD